MSTKSNNTQSNVDKILNSDIYDLTSFVDDIKNRNINGVSGDTLLVGMYGYLGYQFTSELQNSIVVASELSNEAIPARAKFDRNVITHALSLGVKKVTATPASMKVLLIFPEKSLRNNMIDNRFILKSTTAIRFGEYEFHTDYDIQVDFVKLTDSTNGTDMDYVYTARYYIDWANPNPISEIDNEYLPPVSIYKNEEDYDNMVCLITTLHQVEYREIEEKVVQNDVIVNKILNFSFDNQLAHFSIVVKESNGETKELIPIYDGLYTREIKDLNYCYYQYINSNTIRIRFDPSKYQPSVNADISIKVWTTQGYSGNFDYSDDLMVRLTSDEYTNLYMIVKQRSVEGSSGGLDRKTVKELQEIIPKEALSRGSITILSDLRNYFNSINNENSVLHVFRKEDNPLTRVYYTYCLMKDSDGNVVPTNTIPVYLGHNMKDKYDNKTYLESGTPIYYYKYGDGTNVNILRNNYIGYLSEDAIFGKSRYQWNDPENSFNQDSAYGYKFVVNTTIRYNSKDDGTWSEGTIVSMETKNIHSVSNPSVIYPTLVLKIHKQIDGAIDPKYGTVRYLYVPASYDESITQTPDDFPIGTFDPGQGEILKSLYEVDYYSYNSQNINFTFSRLNLTAGDHIRFKYYTSDPDNTSIPWQLAEVLNVEKKNGIVRFVNLLVLNSSTGEFEYKEYRLPNSTDGNSSLGNYLSDSDIVMLYKITKFLYTSPLSIVLTDNPDVGSHRVEASYYLDNIDEERFLNFTHINSRSPLQFIASNIRVKRPSYLSDNRYVYTITVEMVPNTGNITPVMLNRTKLIGVYYKNGTPYYSIGTLISNENDEYLKYEFKMYTRPFSAKTDKNSHVCIDDHHCLYFGTEFLSDEQKEKYNLYEQGTTNKIEELYLNLNTNFRIYTLYKYDECNDDLRDANNRKYMSEDGGTDIPLLSIAPHTIKFDTAVVEQDEQRDGTFVPYTLGDMILTNIYDVEDGINFLYDYSNIMNSYVTMLLDDNIFTDADTKSENSYLVNRVPCVRYFYFNNDQKIISYIKEMKKKILYVLNALDPLECTFGLDFKYFNTYGPSNMYHLTNSDGEVDDVINNVTLTLSFRTKMYNENSDENSIIPLIKNDLKDYIENLENLDDIHFPNITTEIENKYSEHLVYFEFLGFNGYDANKQHIITDEDMEMLTVVPEFLNIDIDDYTGLPKIDIQVVK